MGIDLAELGAMNVLPVDKSKHKTVPFELLRWGNNVRAPLDLGINGELLPNAGG